MKNLTEKGIVRYIRANHGELRHNPLSLKIAAQKTAREYKLNAVDVFLFMIENRPLCGTHSYGFHTRYGRSIRETFEFEYYNK